MWGQPPPAVLRSEAPLGFLCHPDQSIINRSGLDGESARQSVEPLNFVILSAVEEPALRRRPKGSLPVQLLCSRERQSKEFKPRGLYQGTALAVPKSRQKNGALAPASRAVPLALHHTQIRLPRPHSLPILKRHDPRYLVQMRQIMRRPGRQQL